jgi:quaternary ammonium compound-resistance protein SugE
MAWIILLVAGVLEVVWAFLMKSSEGFTRLWPTIGTLVFMAASFGLLSHAMKTLPMGTAYVIWTGIGALGALMVGIVILGEQVNAMRVGGAALILCGMVALKLGSSQ